METTRHKSVCYLLIIAFCLAFPGGCSHYTAPGGPAKLSVFTEQAGITGEVIEILDDQGKVVKIVGRKPTAEFPANIVIVRVQESGYRSYTSESYGEGRFSVVFLRDIEKEEDFERLNRLAGVAQIAPLSRLLLPQHLQSEKDLRVAATRLQADMILIYTLDTQFYRTDKSTPLTVISLGIGQTIDVRVTTSVSALVMDAKTGYIYGTVEETAKEERTTAALTTKNAYDRLRLKTERQAFEQFLDEFEVMWKDIVERNLK